MLGEILQELRKDKGLTQVELSKIVGVSLPPSVLMRHN
ncbi:winged helix-turn-helix transcriptional regulator [Butyricicoccus faecihominis]